MIMKIFISHSSDFDYKNELYIPIRNSILNQENEIILPHETYVDPMKIPSKDVIETCNLIISDISKTSFWVWIELWWANIYNIPILCIYKKWTIFSKSLSVICDNFIEYDNKIDMLIKIEKFIKKYDKN